MPNATRHSDLPRGPFIGSYSGTTAAQNINIGFKPAYIIAYNQTDGDTFWFWSKNDTANVVSIVLAAATTAAVVTQVDNGTDIGFSLPSNAVINENAKVYVFIAFADA